MISSAINIGRRRGEFERAAKTMRAIKSGSRDPASAGVPEISALADIAARITTFFNGQNKEGRLVRGVPDERWINDLADTPLSPMDLELLWVFLPETRMTSIRHGHVFLKFSSRVLAWSEPELFAALGSGYRVAVRFDPTEPQLGAAIFNAQTGSRNFGAWRDGQFLGLADYKPEAPQITACSGFTADDGNALGKRFNAAVRAEYRAIGNFGAPAPATSEARNGRGNVLRCERSGLLSPAPVAGKSSVNPDQADSDLYAAGARTANTVSKRQRAPAADVARPRREIKSMLELIES